MSARAAARAAALLALAACGAPDTAIPATPGAVWRLDPARIRVGEVAELELAVVTPPGRSVAPYEPPAGLPGLEILGSESLPVERGDERWLHRTRFRVRAREAGSLAWPAGSLRVEVGDGSVEELPLAALRIEVPSALAAKPGRERPFGARAPPDPGASGPAFALGMAAGAALALAGAALLRRTRQRHRAPAGPVGPPAEPPWTAALAELSGARRSSADDPLGAAHAGARSLRRYVSLRFRAPARARTTPELAETRPPLAATSRWPVFVALLEELDALRFAAARDAQTAERVEALLVRAERFVEETLPPEPLR